jgi:hypothetical protein
MAFAPCTVCQAGFKGGASTYFPALVQQQDRVSIRHKVCPNCAAVFRDWADQHLSLVSEGDTFHPQQQQLACSNCGGELGDRWAFFLNEYMRGVPERQYYGQVCGKCSAAVAEDWRIPW